jgi:hypothetical protein
VSRWSNVPLAAASSDRVQGHVRVLEPDGVAVDVFDARVEQSILRGRFENGHDAVVPLASVQAVQERRLRGGVIAGYVVGGVGTLLAGLLTVAVLGLSGQL